MLISKFEADNIRKKIADFEEKHNITLPNVYKSFLEKYNGGYTPKTSFKVGKISSNIKLFYGLGEADGYGLDRIYELDEWLERKLLPIASETFGNYISIGLSEDNCGKIFFNDHELGWKTSLLCDSLTEFISKCKSKEISDKVKYTVEEREAILIKRGKGHNINDALRKAWQQEIDKYANIVQEKVLI